MRRHRDPLARCRFRSLRTYLVVAPSLESIELLRLLSLWYVKVRFSTWIACGPYGGMVGSALRAGAVADVAVVAVDMVLPAGMLRKMWELFCAVVYNSMGRRVTLRSSQTEVSINCP
jgi:hypothetical protein